MDKNETEKVTMVFATNKACYGCAMAHEIGDMKPIPEKANCLVYCDDWRLKPDDVAYDGAECRYFLKEENA